MTPNPRSVEVGELAVGPENSGSPTRPESHSWTFADLRPHRPVFVVRRAA